MPKHIIVLGGGAGGTIAANLLARRLKPHEADVTVIDKLGVHLYQPAYLYLSFGWYRREKAMRSERGLLQRRVHLVVDEATHIDPDGRRVTTAKNGDLAYDYLVIATGARLNPGEVPGLAEGAHHFYSEEGALALRGALKDFRGGKVVIGIGGVPYKCPPAPLEFAFLLDWWLKRKGLRDTTEIFFTSPLPRVFPIESVAAMAAPLLEKRGVRIHTFFNLETVDPKTRTATSLEGETLPYDLLVMIPPHRGAAVVTASGLGDGGGWVPTDRYTLKAEGRDGVYVVGDATNLPISKSGAAAHFEASPLVDNLLADMRGTRTEHRYNGKVMCFLETGFDKATLLSFDYDHPPTPPRPSAMYHWLKLMFNKSYWQTVVKGRV